MYPIIQSLQKETKTYDNRIKYLHFRTNNDVKAKYKVSLVKYKN